MNEFVVSTIVGILTGIGGWIVARRKNKAETKITELDAVEKAVKVWRDLSEELQKRYDNVQKKLQEMEMEMEGLRHDCYQLSQENKELIKKLKKITQPKE